MARSCAFARRVLRWLLLLTLLAGTLGCTGQTDRVSPAGEVPNQTAAAGLTPHTRNDGTRWRIGYAESGTRSNYAGTLEGLVQGLNALGWIKLPAPMPYKRGQAESAPIWQWLSANDMGPYVEFVGDAYYTEVNAASAGPLLERLARRGDLDLVIVMGTNAGKALASDQHRTPIMVFSATNAVQAGIITAVNDSGRDHVWAHMDPDRMRRQVEVFHDQFKFKTLGLVYENSDNNRILSAIPDVEEVARQRGIELRRVFVSRPPSETAPKEQYYADLTVAFTELAPQVDAMYLTLGVWERQRLPELLAPFYAAQVPVFAQLGSEEVESGALLSLARPGFAGIGAFGAQSIGRIFSGVRPRELPQVFMDPPTIAWNVAVADMIGLRLPFEALLAADEIYDRIDPH